MESTGLERETLNKLVAFGTRRCRTFLAQKGKRTESILGPAKPSVFLSLLKDQELRIEALRLLTARSDSDYDFLITYKSSPNGRPILATAEPLKDRNNTGPQIAQHMRWSCDSKLDKTLGEPVHAYSYDKVTYSPNQMNLAWESAPECFSSTSYHRLAGLH